ncbi:ABC transporter ATP-binding protein [Donghicola tyrosinivorans]|uniref:ABC-2 type transport system ATP-binding protein n=1 Tax=Donghicola tyrosinivorans TaxID=1652492 RepID=A0A2T0WJL9_9RHOB|nr:ABC transporter ATP-binding protein [Donghicola tyrosinivorans]PRY86852.1 ABC-2 type transport system ATP-binding protein [Donghicola tyrosinivorans]
MTSGLSVENLAYRYGAKEALKGVSFQLEAGEFGALLGPNGAGKSTLFSLLTRLFTAPQGRISIAGHDMGRTPRAALARMGVVFQSSTLDMDLSVKQNLSYFAALHGIAGREAARRSDGALERMNMAERAHERVRDLNGGHRRRTEIARALLHDPAVLLLDEPTVGLDAAARQSITSHVHQLCADQGLTVLWATHLTDEVYDSDHLVLLHQGQILQDGNVGELRSESTLSDHFLNLTGARA